ncbi:MAG: hypothetical protein FWG10_02415 [Eubacteriaceae bacterium]|nr:hypothetical protein [Eubacteriaceae bacterium]
MALTEKQELQRQNLLKACNHIETEYIPNVSINGNAILHYAGMTFKEAEYDEKNTEFVFRNLLSNMHLDVGNITYTGVPNTYEALDWLTETFLCDDGMHLQHLQRPTMKAEEYPLLINDINKFVKDTLLPRKFPPLFEGDKEMAIKKLKIIAEEAASRITGHYNKVSEKVFAEFGFLPLPAGLPRFTHPADYVFDRLRGFQGTLADLRRYPEEFMDTINVIYQQRSERFENVELTERFASYMPHIPCYLNPKQYEKFFFPIYKEIVTNISKSGNKLYKLLEGRWMPFIESFLDLPKDSVVMVIDDDDFFKVYNAIGHHQVMIGGAKLQNTRLLPLDKNVDFAKKVIDECASGGGFMFGANKNWASRGDISQTLIEVYNFAHEYGRK